MNLALFLALIFTSSFSYCADSRKFYHQKILGILNTQFSLRVIELDARYQQKVKKVLSLHKLKSRAYKKIVDENDALKRDLYFFQSGQMKVISGFLKEMNIRELSATHLSLKAFDKIYFPRNYVKNFSKLQKIRGKVEVPKNSMIYELYELFELKLLNDKLGYSHSRKKDFLYALSLLIEKSKISNLKKLKKSLSLRKFRELYLFYIASLKELKLKLT